MRSSRSIVFTMLLVGALLIAPAGGVLGQEPSPSPEVSPDIAASPAPSEAPVLPACPHPPLVLPGAEEAGTSPSASPEPSITPEANPAPVLGVDCQPTLRSVTDLKTDRLDGVTRKEVHAVLKDARYHFWLPGYPRLESDCVRLTKDLSRLPKTERRLVREMACLSWVAGVWAAYASQNPEREWPVSYGVALMVYSAAAEALGKSGAAYLDRGLEQLAESLPSMPELVPTKGHKSAKSIVSSSGKAPSPKRITKLLHDAYAAHIDRLVARGQLGEVPRRGFASALPIVHRCLHPAAAKEDLRAFLQSQACADSVANAWFMYDLTGDERFYDAAKGINDYYLKRADNFNGREYRKRVPCYVRDDAERC